MRTSGPQMAPSPRLIAFYLPQYHPIEENDAWWGKGFTEWRNVAQARPLFPWHAQPHLPADLGFYDLRLPETRAAQAELAAHYGIGGFCYYHYWFSGRRLLQRPFEEVRHSGQPDFPFCLCWANENWTRVWDGGEREILVKQEYSLEDDINHIRHLLPALGDGRYIRIGGKLLLLIYQVSRLPEPRRTADTWRDEVRKAGLGELLLCKVESKPEEHSDPRDQGLDAAVEFAPDWSCLPARLTGTEGTRWWNRPWRDTLHHKLKRFTGGNGHARRYLPRKSANYDMHRVYDYAQLMRNMLAKPDAGYVRFHCVTPMWDNSPRRRAGATIFKGATPELYESWLAENVHRLSSRPAEERVLFVNAWNEWAEGNHLEPCQKWGHAFLQATRRAVSKPEVTLQ